MNIDLLGDMARVQTPFIRLQIGEYTFGVADKSSKDIFNQSTSTGVTFPNLVQNITISKINGTVNTYTITIIYQIRPGDDPNLLEKVFGSVSQTRKIIISYGDYSIPSFIYKNESATITDVKSQVSIQNSSITYNITCVSDSIVAYAGTRNYPAVEDQPSSVIINTLYPELLEIFPGMRDKDKILTKGLIPRDDKKVKIEAQLNISCLDYLKYLISCMTDQTNNGDNILNNSRYIINIYDDISGEFGGAYFKISKISKNLHDINSLDIYEVDVGYQTKDLVTSFDIEDDQAYSILYDYSKEIQQTNFIYDLNKDGSISSIYSPSLTTSKELLKTTASDKTWWTQITQFPIKASLTVTGLLKPALLASYLKINCLFYGRLHISSGYYIITAQKDSIGTSTGYKTTLSLRKIKGIEIDR